MRADAAESAAHPNFATPVDVEKSSGRFVVELKEGENDLLHALAYSGGLPGLNCKNEVLIYKRPRGKKTRTTTTHEEPGTIVRIPLRLQFGQKAPFTNNDIVLRDGDVVYIHKRDDETYNTAGLLGANQFTLPLL